MLKNQDDEAGFNHQGVSSINNSLVLSRCGEHRAELEPYNSHSAHVHSPSKNIFLWRL